MKIIFVGSLLVMLSGCSSSTTQSQESESQYVSNLEAGVDYLLHGHQINTEMAAAEFCECQDSEDKEACYDSWIDKYKDGKASDEDAAIMGETMIECDMKGTMDVLNKIQNSDN